MLSKSVSAPYPTIYRGNLTLTPSKMRFISRIFPRRRPRARRETVWSHFCRWATVGSTARHDTSAAFLRSDPENHQTKRGDRAGWSDNGET